MGDASNTDTVSPGPAPPLPPGGPLEIALSFDTTGSMGGCIQQVRDQVTDIITRLFADIPQLQIALFAHGDYCDKNTYVTKYIDFTNDITALSDFVRKVGMTGGGDWEECYELVLQQVRTKLSWQPGTQRVLVMIGDAVPHDTTYKLNKGKIDWRKETEMLKDMGARIYAVQCMANSSASYFYEHLAKATTGKHLNLDAFGTIVDMMMAICYRETGPEFFEAYEREVRAREGRGIRKELDNMFDTLRDADSTTPTAGTSGDYRTLPIGKRGKRTRDDVESESDNECDKDDAVRPPATKTRKTGTKAGTKATTKAGTKAVKKAETFSLKTFLANNTVHSVNRESVRQNDFLFKDLPWTRWQMSIATAANISSNGSWKPRCGGAVGMRNVGIYADDNDESAVYEFAVQPFGSTAKFPLATRATGGFTGVHWDTYFFRHGKINKQVDRVLTRGCKIYSRRAPFEFDSTTPYSVNIKGRDVNISTVTELRLLMNKVYDYAWRERHIAGQSHGYRKVTRSDVTISEV